MRHSQLADNGLNVAACTCHCIDKSEVNRWEETYHVVSKGRFERSQIVPIVIDIVNQFSQKSRRINY